MKTTALLPLRFFLAALGVMSVVASGFFLFSAANAHAEVVSTSPVDNTQVVSPAQISVTFTEELVLEYSYISLFDGAGNPVPQEPATVDASGRVMSSGIPQTLAAGMYRAAWHALSVDGHETDGAFFFEVTSGTGGDGSAPSEPIAEPTAATFAAQDESRGTAPYTMAMPAG